MKFLKCFVEQMRCGKVFYIFWQAQSFVFCCANNKVHIEGLTNFLSRKGQLTGNLACFNLTCRFTGLISFCKIIFEVHDSRDEISGPFHHNHSHFPASCLGLDFQHYHLQKMQLSHQFILNGQLQLLVNHYNRLQHCKNRFDA